ncbi:MAG TPA: hypothetical protein DGG95_14100 [Cytophagales bacterium]|nr:hypothetical protein [Cytophagales bacterium]
MSLCILAAIVFWLFNAFNKNYSANIKFPIKFEFDGEKYIPADHLPQNVNVNVNGIGWEIFWNHIGWKTPQIILPLEQPADIKKIVASTLVPVVASQIGNLKVNFIVTDTLRIKIDRKISKRFKLYADVSNIEFNDGFGRVSPVVILPDSVLLEGPESHVRNIKDSIVLSVSANNVNENFRYEADILFEGSEFVKRDPSIAQVMFDVGTVQVISKKMRVGAEKNLLTSLPDSLTVKFQVPSKRVEEFESHFKEIQLKVIQIKTDGSKTLTSKILNLPSYAELVDIDSVRKVGKPNL